MRYAITGASRGLGLEFVRQLLRRGDVVEAGVLLLEENADELQALARESEGRLRVHPLDVTDPASVATFAREVDGGGPLDGLINNAGIFDPTGSVAGLDFQALLRTFDINTLGALRVTAALLPALRRGSSRRIACLSSRAGSVSDNSSGGLYGYRLSKAALNMAVRNLALELRPEGFTVLALHPGWVRTDMGGPSAPQSPEESVRGLLQVLDGARSEDTGRFLDFRGQEVPW
jgi:NAD(P)-dependent dehydrogenase (short-subunit alcohol dehydrogenase family)